MKRTFAALCLGLLMTLAAPLWAAPPQMGASQTKTLYQRLGGYDALAAVTDDFLGRLSSDPQMKQFFMGFNESSLHRIRQDIVDFLCQATGGPCVYHGTDMKTAHTGLHITESQWDAAVKDLVATLDKFKVPEQEKNEVLNAVGSTKNDIVGH